MKRCSIRFRLAVWYSAVLALALVAFGGVSWIAVRHVLFHTADETLRDRVEGVRKFMNEQIGALSVEEIRDEFKSTCAWTRRRFVPVCDAEESGLCSCR
jgi:hypothetical protein